MPTQNYMAKNKGSIEERLLRSMEQAVEISEGLRTAAREYDLPLTVRRAQVPAAPEYDSSQVVAIRNKLRLSQALFAQALNVSPGTVRSWEHGEKPPQGPSRRLLEIAARSPEIILNAVEVKTSMAPRDTTLKHASGANSQKERRTGRDRRRGGSPKA